MDNDGARSDTLPPTVTKRDELTEPLHFFQKVMALGSKHETCRLHVEALQQLDTSGTIVLIKDERQGHFVQLLQKVLKLHPEIHDKEKDERRHAGAWGDQSDPFGWPMKEGPYGEVQRYLAWKNNYGGQASFEVWKEFISRFSKLRYINAHSLEQLTANGDLDTASGGLDTASSDDDDSDSIMAE